MSLEAKTHPPILIVGAGPTGLALALWLTHLGVPVRIIDRAPEPGLTSRALAVQVRTLELYRQLGMAESLIEGGVKIEWINFWVHGTRAAQAPFRRIGEGLTPYPFVLIYPQDAHERLLIERLGALGVNVERRTELTRLDPHADGVRVALTLPDGREEIRDTPYLAGCDGASSTVRELLDIGFPGGTYSGFFYVADVEASGPATDGGIHVDLEEADFALLFPLRGKGRVRLVGLVRDLDSRDLARLTFEDVRGRAIGSLKLDVSKVNWFSTYRVHHRVASRYREGRVFLLGDAAHIHSPVGGQGMNTGIGDAVNLAWKLADVMKGRARENLLDTYEPERIAFARRLVATTDRVFTFVTMRGAVARLVRTKLVPMIAPLILRVPAMRRFLFRTASQTGIRYPDSPLSEGRAGRVQGGDRLPWIETAPGQDNFSPLTSLKWQAHVYGEPRPGLEEACAEARIELHRFAWQPRMGRAGLQKDALYLVRPDGHVALADPSADAAVLLRYFRTRGIMVVRG